MRAKTERLITKVGEIMIDKAWLIYGILANLAMTFLLYQLEHKESAYISVSITLSLAWVLAGIKKQKDK